MPTAAGQSRVWTWAVAGATAYLTLALLALRGTPDVDLWLHLALGDRLRRGGGFGLPDPFVVLADQPYRASQWLADATGSWVWDQGGMPAVQLLRLGCVLALVTFVLLATHAVAGPLAAGVATAVGATASAAGWGERPQVLGLALLAMCSWLWWRGLVRHRAPWLVLPLISLWANVHGTWVVGLALGLVMVAVARWDERLTGPTTARFGLVALGSVIAATVTPSGPAGLLAPIRVGAALGGRVNEWRPPTLTNPLFLLVLMAGIVVVARWVRTRRLPPGRALLLVGALAGAMSAIRLVAVAAILMAPLLAEALSTAVASERRRRPEAAWAVAGLVVALGGAWLGLTRPHPEPAQGAPAAAVQALASGTVIAADPRLQGWLQWRRPDVRLLRDLRSELYSASTAEAYEAFSQAGPGWPTYAARYDVAALLLDVNSPLGSAAAAEGWTRAGADSTWVLWVRPSS